MRMLPGKSFSSPARMVWLVFLIWTALGISFVGLGIDDAWLAGRALGPELKGFLRGCLGWGDFVFNVLAVLNIYYAAVERLGLARTRRAALTILPMAGVLEFVGTKTGIPFGAYHYTDTFGPRILGVLPVAIPLAWFTVVVGGYLFLSQAFPRVGRPGLCLLTGMLALFLDWVMEPFAYGIRFYWLWETGSAPWQNYLTWFVASAVLAAITPLHAPARARARADIRPPAVLAAMLLMFAVGRIVYGV